MLPSAKLSTNRQHSVFETQGLRIERQEIMVFEERKKERIEVLSLTKHKFEADIVLCIWCIWCLC